MATVTLENDAFDNIDNALSQARDLLEALLMLIDDFDGSSQQEGTAPMRCVADVVSEKIAEAEKIFRHPKMVGAPQPGDAGRWRRWRRWRRCRGAEHFDAAASAAACCCLS